jgi:hypothetical protein
MIRKRVEARARTTLIAILKVWWLEDMFISD